MQIRATQTMSAMTTQYHSAATEDSLISSMIPPSLPWGAGTVSWGNTEAVLTNTSPIDSILTFIHVLLLSLKDIKRSLEIARFDVAHILLAVHNLMLQRQWAEAKVLWLATSNRSSSTLRWPDNRCAWV